MYVFVAAVVGNWQKVAF